MIFLLSLFSKSTAFISMLFTFLIEYNTYCIGKISLEYIILFFFTGNEYYQYTVVPYSNREEVSLKDLDSGSVGMLCSITSIY